MWRVARIGFIGLGIMGAPMAANLVDAGHEVWGFSRTPATREAVRTRGVIPAESVAQAVADADYVITMLPDTPDVERVALGDGGILAGISPSALYIDMSTIEPAMAREIAERFAAKGIKSLDAPVSGGEAGAVAGSLSIMVGGDEAAFQEASAILRVMGTTVGRVGAAGSGQAVKAANQLMVAGHLQMLAEALVFLRAQGVKPGPALDVIAGGLAGSAVIERKRDAYLSAQFDPGFRVELHHKDLGIVQRAARASAVSLPLTAAVGQLVQALVAQGHGGLDHSALYLLASGSNGQAL